MSDMAPLICIRNVPILCRLYYGRLPNYRLSDVGMQQARQAGQYLAQIVPCISTLYSSPLLRTRQTAGQVAAELLTLPQQSCVEIRTQEDLLEESLHKM